MNIIVLQHIKIEDPGFIKDLMLADNVNLTTIELDDGERIPSDLTKFDGMFCMGGPMDTYMEKEYPWLVDEKNKIKPVIPVTTKLFDHKVGSINHKNSIEILKYLNDTRG